MYIPTAPLPELALFLNLASANRDGVAKLWQCSDADKVLSFRRGQFALFHAAKSLARDPQHPVVYIPSYFCDSSLRLLRNNGGVIVFYDVNEDLSPNWDDVRNRAILTKPDIFVLVHTFGRIQDNAEALSFSEEARCTLLEDGAHVLRPVSEIGNGKSLVLFSPHKLLALPPISFLSVPERYIHKFTYSPHPRWFSNDGAWLVKRIIQNILVKAGSLAPDIKYKRASLSNSMPSDELIGIDCVSSLGRALLPRNSQALNKIAETRLRNFNALLRGISRISAVSVPDIYCKWTVGTPYLFPLFIGKEFQDPVYYALLELGIPVQRWPDLPVEVTKNREVYPSANAWRNEIILLPVHQSIRKSHIDKILRSITQIMNSACSKS